MGARRLADPSTAIPGDHHGLVSMQVSFLYLGILCKMGRSAEATSSVAVPLAISTQGRPKQIKPAVQGHLQGT